MPIDAAAFERILSLAQTAADAMTARGARARGRRRAAARGHPHHARDPPPATRSGAARADPQGLRGRHLRALRRQPTAVALRRGDASPSGARSWPSATCAPSGPTSRRRSRRRKQPGFDAARRRNIDAALHLAEHLHEAPVHLFVAGRTRRGEPQVQALFPAIQNVLLACRAVGLGASLTTVHRAYGDEIDRFLGLPEGIAELRAAPDRLAARPLRPPAAAQRRRVPVLRALRGAGISASRNSPARRRTRSSASRRGRGSTARCTRGWAFFSAHSSFTSSRFAIGPLLRRQPRCSQPAAHSLSVFTHSSLSEWTVSCRVRGQQLEGRDQRAQLHAVVGGGGIAAVLLRDHAIVLDPHDAPAAGAGIPLAGAVGEDARLGARAGSARAPPRA